MSPYLKWTLAGLICLAASATSAAAQSIDQLHSQCRTPGTSHADSGSKAAACTALLQAGGFTPVGVANLHLNRGNHYLEQRDFDRALADYDAAIRLNPGDAMFHQARGDVFLHRGDNAGAIVNYNEAIRLDPRNVQAYANRANAYHRLGDAARAAADSEAYARLTGQ